MTLTATNLSLDFIFPKVHGLWADSFFGERLDTLIRGGLHGFGRAMAVRDVQVTRREEVQKRLTLNFIEELAGVRKFLPDDLARFYDGFIRRFFFEDVKTLVRAWHRKETGERLRDLLLLSDRFPKLSVEKMLAAKNINQFHRLLPEAALRDALLPILVELDDRDDVWLAESRIDRLTMNEFHRTAKALGGATRRAAIELTGMEIDIENIVLLLRKNGVADFPADRFESFVLENGKALTSRRVLELAELSNWAEVVERLPSEYSGPLRKMMDAEAHQQETALWRVFNRRALTWFRDFNHPALSAMVYPYLKRIETTNLARIFEGLHLRLDPTFIHSILVR